MTDDPDRYLTLKQALAMLPDGDLIHTFRQAGPAVLGCDMPREDIVQALKDGKPELGGEACTEMGHGLIVIDDTGPLFIETRKEKKDGD